MPLVSLNNRFVSSLKPKDTTVVFWDKTIKSLILKLHPSGKKSFYYIKKVNNTRVYKCFGTFPTIDCVTARTVAKNQAIQSLLSANKKTHSNTQEKHARIKTFELYMDSFEREHISQVKPKTQ